MIKLNESLTIFEDENNPFWFCGVRTEENDYHGNMIVFSQSFPHPLLGTTTEQVMIREQDLDRLIDWLQSIKNPENKEV